MFEVPPAHTVQPYSTHPSIHRFQVLVKMQYPFKRHSIHFTLRGIRSTRLQNVLRNWGSDSNKKRIRRLWARWVAVRLISVNWNEMWAQWMERRKIFDARFQWNENEKKNFSHSLWPRAHRKSNSKFTTRHHLLRLRFDRRIAIDWAEKKFKEITISRRWRWWEMRIAPQTELWYKVIRWPLATPLFTLNFFISFFALKSFLLIHNKYLYNIYDNQG